MIKRILLALMLLTVPVMASAQRPPEAVAQDGSNSPPLASEFGPQAAIADGFDVTNSSPYYQYLGTHSEPPEVDGAFRFLCAPTHTAADDPIVNPGAPGAAHIHTFFGNRGTNAYSTYTSLRTTGESTCINKLIRSAYWLPAVIDGPGIDAKVVWPNYILVYYKRNQISGPYCTPGNPAYMGRCVGLPNGIKIIAGYDMITGTAPSGSTSFSCITSSVVSGSPYDQAGEKSSDMVTAAATCPTPPGGATNVKYLLNLLADMPRCWDGVNLDSTNHRSHVVDTLKISGVGEWCPKTHPYLIPTYTAQIRYPIDSTLNQTGTWVSGQNTWYLSSDRMPGMTLKRPGTTFHFDLWDGQNQNMKERYTHNCVDLGLNCSAGDMGDGYGLKEDHAEPAPIAKTVRPKMNKEAATSVIHGAHP